jgi:hypothetical protein
LIGFRHDFIKYFDERFPFFGFSLPLLVLIFPIIPNMVPLYFLPKYYGLIVTYLFLIIFNLRLYRDLMEKRVTERSFYFLYLASCLTLFTFSILFHFLEMGRSLSLLNSGLNLNWRSFFFFLSTFSLVSISWLWYSVLRPSLKRSYFTELAPMIKYPLILIPPVLLKVHESQIELLLYYSGVIFFHAVCFELLHNDFLKKASSHNRCVQGSLFIYTFLIGPGFYFYHDDFIIASVLTMIGLVYTFKAQGLNPKALFITTIVFNWAALFTQ